MPRYEPVDPGQSFPALEERVLERWRERDVFHESVRRRAGGKRFVFDERLDERAYIVPGLGDAGDRQFGAG